MSSPESSPDREQQERARRRQRRLQSELRDLQQQQTTFFPNDEEYDATNTTAIDDTNEMESDDGDYVEGEGEEEALPEEGVNYIMEQQQEHEEEGEGEDLLENAFQDYQRIEALDTYGREGIDEREYNQMGLEERSAAEREIADRETDDLKRRGIGGRSGQFYDGLMEVEEDDDARRQRRGRMGRGADLDDTLDREDEAEVEGDRVMDEEELFETEEEVNLEAFDVPLREWIAQERTRTEVQRKFRRFLMTFEPSDDEAEANDDNAKKRKRKNIIYEDRIRNMCASNLQSLEVSYMHLMEAAPTLAMWLVDAPRDMFDVLNEVATYHTRRIFPSYGAIQDEIIVRVAGMPIMDSLRALRRTHLDTLIKVNGVVTRRSSVYPQLKLAYYDCVRCKDTMGPYRVDEASLMSSSGPDGSAKDAAEMHQPSACSGCDSEGPFRMNATRSHYRNYQRVNLQETPGSVPPGRVPRTKEIILTNDLIDAARPGEEVEITGIYSHTYDYSLTQKSGFPVFSTFIFANHLRRKEDASAVANLSEADKAEILELARDPKIGDRIVESIAPSIYGHKHVKTALAMSLFGAVPKNISDKHRIRGDINVLLLGDPGTAKSQMLKYAEKTAPRAVYSTGKGASAVGLTASVHKDPITKEWTLEGGALVLADRGVCLIDEFDKMNEQDRTSIHEAMEQQTISVSKAGIVTSLQARCAVLAAANPIGGRYDSSCTFAENVELTDPILQRFDLLCVLQDTVDPVADERLALFVTGSHMRSVSTNEYTRGLVELPNLEAGETTGSGYSKAKIIPQDLLRKYIQYARTNVKPVLRGNTFDQEKIASLYVALRKESAISGGVPIAVRHIESIMRLAEAHAKMHLREYVRDDDMDASIGMMLQSFITAQKFSVRRQLKRSFAKFLSSGEDRAHLLLHILQGMMRNEQVYQTIRLRQRNQGLEMLDTLEIPLSEFEGKARERRIYDVSEFCAGEAFQEAGYHLDTGRGVISRDPAL
jgi:DNA replication licensing factor MCM2